MKRKTMKVRKAGRTVKDKHNKVLEQTGGTVRDPAEIEKLNTPATQPEPKQEKGDADKA